MLFYEGGRKQDCIMQIHVFAIAGYMSILFTLATFGTYKHLNSNKIESRMPCFVG